MLKHLKVEVFVQEKDVVRIANVLNEEGIIKEGNYDYVFVLTNVKGHFRPIEGADPYCGEIGIVNEVDEIKMEFRIREEDLEKSRKIIEINHSYEEPVINYIPLVE